MSPTPENVLKTCLQNKPKLRAASKQRALKAAFPNLRPRRPGESALELSSIGNKDGASLAAFTSKRSSRSSRKQASSFTLTLPPAIAEKVRTICGIIERTPEWYVLQNLSNYLNDVLDGRIGELEGTTLLFDTMAEAKRVTAKSDLADRKIRHWQFSRMGGKVRADYGGLEIPLIQKEVA